MKKKNVQKVLGSFLFYARAIDMTILHALSAIASEQEKPTKKAIERIHQLLDCMATHPDAVVRFYASDMILNLHSDASYLSVGKGRNRAGGYFFLGSVPRDNQNIQLNGNIHIICAILKLVAASAAEAELGALFFNVQEARIIRLTLLELGHPQPPTPIHVDNITTVGIVNNNIKRQCSKAMEMIYFCLLDQKNNKYFKVYYKPGAENKGDYPSKAHIGAIHTHVRPYYLHTNISPRTLLRAYKPSSRQGCVETLGSTDYKGVPLPRIPKDRKLGKESYVSHQVNYATVQPRGQYKRSRRIAQFAAKIHMKIQRTRNWAIVRCAQQNTQLRWTPKKQEVIDQ